MTVGTTLPAAANSIGYADVSTASSPDVPYSPAAYRLVRSLGRGAMGKVMLARRRHSTMLRAVKFSRSLEPVGAAALVGIRHIHLARVYAVERLGPRYVTTMEHVAGRTWHDIVVAHGPLSPELTVWLGAQAAAALAALHRRGWLHRDIQPRNLMVDSRSVVKIVDYDLLYPLGGPLSAADRLVAGTPDYMAPDQLCDQPLTDKADVYSLGCALYFLLTGTPLYRTHDTGATGRMLNHARLPVPDFMALRPDLGYMFASLLGQMLDKSPEARPSADNVARVLGKLAGENRHGPMPAPATIVPAVSLDAGASLCHTGTFQDGKANRPEDATWVSAR